MREFVKASRHFIISDYISCDIHSHIDLYVGSGCNIVKGEKKFDGWVQSVARATIPQPSDGKAEKKNKCVAVKQNTVESRFTDTLLTPYCNKPFLPEGRKFLS